MENTAIFPKSSRLLKSNEFASMRNNSKSLPGDGYRIIWKSTSLGVPRLGLAVSSKIGNAVIRNKIKRVVRESFRKSQLTCSVDFLFIPGKKIIIGELSKDLELSFKEF